MPAKRGEGAQASTRRKSLRDVQTCSLASSREENLPHAPLAAPSPRMRGEGGVRGRSRWAQICGAQIAERPPHPRSLRHSTSPRTRGEVKRALPFPRRTPRPSFAKPLPRTNVRTLIFAEGASGGSGCRHDHALQDKTFCKPKLSASQEIKGGGTPKNADPYPPHLATRLAPCGTRSPFGVPPRLSLRGISIAKAQLQAALPGTRSDTGVIRLRLSQSSGHLPYAGHNAGGRDAQSRPGASVTSPARGHRSRSVIRPSPADVPSRERDFAASHKKGTRVNRNVTARFDLS